MSTGTRRGRPARFSREQIVEAAASMVLADPQTRLTVARAAAAVGAKPMAIYGHFADHDDLVAAVAQRVFADFHQPADIDAPWQDAIGGWMRAKLHMAARVPQFVQLSASGESAGWLVDYAYLARIFERNDVGDVHKIAEAVHWIGSITMGLALSRAMRHGALSSDRLHETVRRLTDDDAASVSRYLPSLDDLREHGGEQVVTWTIEALEQRLAAPPGTGRRRSATR